jgi:hypothetical protein
MPSTLRRPNRLPTMRDLPTNPRGPRLYSQRPKRLGGPGVPPPGFVGGQTSAEEWWVYWALAKIFDDPADPRQPPFLGARDGRWTYQSPFAGGRRMAGGAVIDFVVYAGGEVIAIRLQTERFHIYATGGQQTHDLEQEAVISEYARVIDLFSQDFIGDGTGQAVIIQLKDALAGFPPRDPITSGTARRSRMAKVD